MYKHITDKMTAKKKKTVNAMSSNKANVNICENIKAIKLLNGMPQISSSKSLQ